MSTNIVVCDDEELIRWSLASHLESEGYNVTTASNGKEALQKVTEQGARLLLTDLKMPVMDGLTALRELRASGSSIPVVVLTAHGGVDAAIEATRLGADGYLQKPFDLREVSLAIEQALNKDRLRREVHYHRERDRSGYGEFVGRAPVLQPLFSTLERLENVDAPTVLITGESGTGKDVLARAIHARGPRRDRPFVAVDCASLPEHLIESELFGHERGAFTDAKATKQGLFEVAEKGVVFLDEIGELPLNTQSKLLRALEDRTFKRVGGVRRTTMDVAILAATNRDLKAEVDAGKFREDLYFRLNVIRVQLPALRDRREDVPYLVSHFLETFSKRFGRDMEGVDGAAMAKLQSYRWPGNVRELRNVVERLVLLAPEGRIHLEDLPPEIQFGGGGPAGGVRSGGFVLPEDGVNLEEVERSLIVQALQRTDNNQSASARLLGISRYALRYRMEKFGLK
ncbi:MAG: sigma-54-dependent Fis family transcriptional regulator [Myxococcales bacterium]|nr:sigma-54-dependent Fis family transcriptional regulator [Myxococcales bacterium]MCB9671819.1 sigma-54-dependent Fis family transcriptional regulator [Alphaproteobacteria bacterium]